MDRHVYQRSKGGAAIVPLENKARIVGSSTPRFAKMVSWKYAQLPASKVSQDLEENHHRKTSRKLIQKIGAVVGQMAQQKELDWVYELPQLESVVSHISVSRDGTTTPILREGYRETMCGTISFYDSTGSRMHTIYSARAPEYGKESFDRVMDMELDRVKKQYPKVQYIGLADGAKNNWTYLEKCTSIHILDFFHATEHLAEVSYVMNNDEKLRQQWLCGASQDLKHKTRGAKMILMELKHHRKTFTAQVPEVLEKTITYFENNLHRMNYAAFQKQGYPIGSGVTEAACKVLAKQRLNGSGMKWTIEVAQHILLLRGLICTKGRWTQFWQHFDRIRA